MSAGGGSCAVTTISNTSKTTYHSVSSTAALHSSHNKDEHYNTKITAVLEIVIDTTGD